VDLWTETVVTSTDSFFVQINGEGADRLSSGKHNLIIRAAQRLADRIHTTLPPFRAECINRIPLSSGLGSSAAAILTGLLAGNALLENPLSKDAILDLAAGMDGHADNVAPALMGGLVVSTLEKKNVIARQIPLGGDIHITIALPDFYLPTKQARAALPGKISMKNAIHNISRTALVTEAFRTGDLNLLGETMTDTLHQPYRLKLIPGAKSAMEAAKEAGASAGALSGAGPSVIAFSSNTDAGIGESMKRAFVEVGLDSRVYQLKVSHKGADIKESCVP